VGGRGAVGLAVAGAGLAVALPWVAALAWDDYRHRSQYISELGAHDAPHGALVSAGFVAVGVLLVGATALLAPRFRWSWPASAGAVCVGGGLGVSYAVSGVARCDAGCPEGGATSAAQEVHNAVGSLGYALAIGGLVLFGLAARRAPRWRTVALAGLVAAPVLLADGILASAADDWRGVTQRVLEVGILAWFVAVTARASGGGPGGPGAGRPGG
jgi:hypothetical protein